MSIGIRPYGMANQGVSFKGGPQEFEQLVARTGKAAINGTRAKGAGKFEPIVAEMVLAKMGKSADEAGFLNLGAVDSFTRHARTK